MAYPHNNAQNWNWQQQQAQMQAHPNHYAQARYEVMRQEPYNSPSHTTTVPALGEHPIIFRNIGPPGGNFGVRARDMLNGAFQNLQYADSRLRIPEEIKGKITIRIHPKGYKPFSMPKYIRETDNQPITYAKMAQRIAEVLNEWLESPETQQHVPPPDCIRFGTGPGYIGLDNMFIASLHHRSRGSFQPEITLYVS